MKSLKNTGLNITRLVRFYNVIFTDFKQGRLSDFAGRARRFSEHMV